MNGYDPTAKEILAAARQYVAAGSSVVPISTDGSKTPAIKWKEFQSRIASDDEVRRWWRYPSGIGIICGAISGNLEVIDNDAPELWTEYCELIESHDPELYKRLVVIETPSGGKHTYYRCEQIGPNQKLAMRAVEVPKNTPGAKQDGDRWIILEVLFETRGEGGLIVAPGGPLNVHSSGKPYKLIRGSVDAIPTITTEQRDLLLGLARALNKYQPREERHERKEYKQGDRCVADRLRPGDDYNERGDPLEVLLNHGWTSSARRGSIVFLRKPGKRGKGHQATLHAVGHNIFYCFSTSAAPFEERKSYMPFQILALLEYNGDFAATARALAVREYGSLKQQQEESKGPTENSTKPRELTGREQIICRTFAEVGISDESFRTYIATRAIANGRKIFRLSSALITRHIRITEGYETDKVFGWRRIDKMKKELKRKFNYPLFTRIEQAIYNPDPRKKSLPAKYKLDETPFDEAEAIAAEHPAMQYGDGYIPGKAREEAAIKIAQRYRFAEKQLPEKREELSEFQQLKNAEKRFESALKKMHDLMEDMGEPTLGFQNKARACKSKVDEILLKRKRKSKRKNSPRDGQKSTDFSAVNEGDNLGYIPYVVTPMKPRENDATEPVTKRSEDSWLHDSKSDLLVNAIIEDETESEALTILYKR